ncbi:ATP-grasp domain-containing protein [Pseudothermotoga sp. U03pept]|uniref:ATP-grasp domain-containing protein n=1 Tax=Pseudothermotoga sp. U03pept TaxID=3447012 RepID=UPI003EFEC874
MLRFFGFDTTENIPTKFFVDRLFNVRKASDKDGFLEDLIDLLNDTDIDIYIPVHSEECRVVAKREKELRRETKIRFMISPSRTFQVLDDKSNAYQALSKIGVRTPKIFEKSEEITSFPIVGKPKIGSGSKGFVKISNRDEFLQFQKENRDALFVEYITGSEYTVDAFFNSEGKLVTYNQRIRLKTLGGAAVITQNDFAVDVKNQIERISSAYKINGPANFQFFHTPESEVVFTDINLRFASGGLPLTVESGANIVELLILELLGYKYDPNKYQSDRKKRIMYRYFEEIFEEL